MNHYLETQPGRTAFIQGKEYLFFSGYTYLGMQHVPEFTALVKEGTDKYGWLFPSSRISNTRLKLYEDCEALLSQITGAEETVLTSSGYMAGRMAVAKWRDEIINIHPSHPAIRARNNKPSAKAFAVDSVDVLAATITDFSFLNQSDDKKIIIVDDSHGTGILGNEGEGIASRLPHNQATECIITYSLSKGFNILGGAVSCSSGFAKELRSMPQYITGAGPSPSLLYAFLHGRHLYRYQREKLKSNIHCFQSLIKDMKGIHHHPELPIFILPENIDEEKLFHKNIIISSFAYPDPSGRKISRIVLNALHTATDLEYLAGYLHTLIPHTF